MNSVSDGILEHGLWPTYYKEEGAMKIRTIKLSEVPNNMVDDLATLSVAFEPERP